MKVVHHVCMLDLVELLQYAYQKTFENYYPRLSCYRRRALSKVI